MATINEIKPAEIRAGKGQKAAGTAKNFDAFLGGVGAFGPAGVVATQQYGDVNSAAVLSAAFSGVSSLNAQTAGAGSYPSFAFGGGLTEHASVGKMGGGVLNPNAPVIPGAEGFSQADLINSMNQNNLRLLELQATMQSNMQAWNTKSNILSADHRARMAMIEKFTARG